MEQKKFNMSFSSSEEGASVDVVQRAEKEFSQLSSDSPKGYKDCPIQFEMCGIPNEETIHKPLKKLKMPVEMEK